MLGLFILLIDQLADLLESCFSRADKLQGLLVVASFIDPLGIPACQQLGRFGGHRPQGGQLVPEESLVLVVQVRILRYGVSQESLVVKELGQLVEQPLPAFLSHDPPDTLDVLAVLQLR